jgi:predicted nucleic acid-binding protein
VILDSAVVIALARRHPIVRAHIEQALHQRDLVVIPTVVIAEATRGEAGRDASVNQVIKAATR